MRFVRRGRASKPKSDLDSDADSNYEEVASDLDNEDELREWLSSTQVKGKGVLPGEVLVKKFLPPGTVADLYEHYKATQSMLGGYAVS